MDMIGSTTAYVEMTTHKKGAAQVRASSALRGAQQHPHSCICHDLWTRLAARGHLHWVA